MTNSGRTSVQRPWAARAHHVDSVVSFATMTVLLRRRTRPAARRQLSIESNPIAFVSSRNELLSQLVSLAVAGG